MLTIKHVKSSGDEYLFLTKGARYEPARVTSLSTPTPETVWCDDRGEEFPITGGKVYVMNEAGATVAKYHLDTPSPIPQ